MRYKLNSALAGPSKKHEKTEIMEFHLVSLFLRLFIIAACLIPQLRSVAEETDSTSNPVTEPFSQGAHVSLCVPLQSSENLSFGAVTETHDEDISHVTEGDSQSASDLNRKLT